MLFARGGPFKDNAPGALFFLPPSKVIRFGTSRIMGQKFLIFYVLLSSIEGQLLVYASHRCIPFEAVMGELMPCAGNRKE